VKKPSKPARRAPAAARTKPQRSALPPALHLNERFRLKPHELRLTENRDGVVVPSRIQLFRTGTFRKDMPDGKSVTFTITRSDLEAMEENWKNKVRGQDIAVDFAHKSDEEAAAWITDIAIEDTPRGSTLWAEVDWTTDGYAAVAGRKFRYMSPDFAFAWKDNETGQTYGPTLFGAGLTNRPVIKNMAPTVELTEVDDMAKKVTKKVSEMTAEELRLKLAEEKDEEKKELLQLRLDEMAEGEGDDEEEGEEEAAEEPPPAESKKKGGKAVDDMSLDELKAAFQKQCEELAEMKKGMAKQLAESQTREKEASFTMLCAEGKAVPAQKDAFMKGDMVKFAELAQPVKLSTVGDTGAPATKPSTSAQDEVLKLAEEAKKAGRVTKTGDAISLVLSENKELHARYIKEMDGEEKSA
jgi:hypothetical protein